MNLFNGWVAHFEVLNRQLAAQEETDVHSWSQSYYGTP